MSGRRRHAIFAADIRSIGGVVTIASGRDRITSEWFFQVVHVFGGGDIVWRSRRLHDEDRAIATSRVLAEYTGAVVRL
jgi:hypothetical protein